MVGQVRRILSIIALIMGFSIVIAENYTHQMTINTFILGGETEGLSVTLSYNRVNITNARVCSFNYPKPHYNTGVYNATVETNRCYSVYASTTRDISYLGLHFAISRDKDVDGVFHSVNTIPKKVYESCESGTEYHQYYIYPYLVYPETINFVLIYE